MRIGEITNSAEYRMDEENRNLTICKTIKISKILNLMVNYHICILSVRII